MVLRDGCPLSGEVGGEACGVSVVRGDVGSTTRIEGAHLHIRPRAGVAEVTEGKVRDAADKVVAGVLGKVRLSKTRPGGGDDTGGTEHSLAYDAERVAGGVVHGTLAADATWTHGRPVPAVKTDLAVTATMGTVSADGGMARWDVRDGRSEEEINGEGDGEVVRRMELEGTGGKLGGGRRRGDTAEPSGRARGNGAVEEAGAANGIRGIVEAEEGEGVHSGGSIRLQVGVRPIVKRIEVVDAVGGGGQGRGDRRCTEGGGGGGGVSMEEHGVHVGEVGCGRHEGGEGGVGGSLLTRACDALPAAREARLEGEGDGTEVSHAELAERVEPVRHVVPDSSPAAVEGTVMHGGRSIALRRVGTRRASEGCEAMAGEPSRKRSECSRVNVDPRAGRGGDESEVGIQHVCVEGTEVDGGRGGGGKHTHEVGEARMDAVTEEKVVLIGSIA